MRDRDTLTQLKVAFNCPAKWSAMNGDDRARHCTHCDRNVYNISDMGREEAIDFLESKGEKVCIRYYQRNDGTILTKPCGRMKRAVYRTRIAIGSGLAALGFVFIPAFCFPVMGVRITREAMIRSSLRSLTRLRGDLAAEKDPETREMLVEQIKDTEKTLLLNYEKATPEELDKWADYKH